MDNNNKILNGKPLSSLVSFMLPILGALLLQTVYGTVDMFIVGQFCDKESVSAIGTGSFITYIATILISGLITGSSVIIGRSIGENDRKMATKAVSSSVSFFIIAGAVMTALLAVCSKPLVAIMQTPKESFNEAVQYVFICSLGMIFITFYNLFAGIYRGIGNSKLPLIFVVISCVINIIGDLVLIAGFKMGVAGAAIATIFAQAVSVFISIAVILKKELPFDFSLKNVRFKNSEYKEILKIGLPIGLQDFITQISFIVVNALINNMGIDYSAGYGIAQKIICFMTLVPTALMISISTFVAQNTGARQIKRAKKILFCGMKIAFCVGAIMFCLGFFLGGPLSSIFIQNDSVIKYSAEYLKGFSFDCITLSILFCFMGYFNGRGKSRFVMIQGIVSAFAVKIPLLFWLSNQSWVNLTYMGLATPLSTLVCIVLCILYYTLSKWNKD